MEKIEGFQKEFRWLSNFWPATVEFEGIVYPSSEHAYQAAKTDNQDLRKMIRDLASPGEAKRFGKKVAFRPGWEAMKLDVMERIIREKFKNPALAKQLRATWPAELIEKNHWRDHFWGVCQGVGHNHLGKILMKVRDELLTSESQKV